MNRNRRYLPGPAVGSRYNISPMTRWPWQRDAELNFPKPLIINGQKYFSEQDLDEWDRELALMCSKAESSVTTSLTDIEICSRRTSSMTLRTGIATYWFVVTARMRPVSGSLK